MWEQWLVFEPWKIVALATPFFFIYFYAVHRLEKWLHQRDLNRERSPGYFTPMDLAPVEPVREFE